MEGHSEVMELKQQIQKLLLTSHLSRRPIGLPYQGKEE
ncbi:Uncharacterised protein [Vibrio cholerae]|nr:Uncharacterised protein [Vibrio cholerae]